MSRTFGIFLLTLTLLLAACGGDDDSDPTATTTSASSDNPTATTSSDDEEDDADGVRAPLEVGSSAEVRSEDPDPATAGNANTEGAVKVTITDIIDDPDVENVLLVPQENHKYWALEVTMEATSDKVVNTGIWSIRLADGQHLASTYTLETFGPEITYASIEPGETRAGLIMFEIPDDAVIEEVEGSMSIYVGGTIVFEAE